MKKLLNRLLQMRWELGIIDCQDSAYNRGGVCGGVGDLTNNQLLNNIRWVKNPFRDRWFADPFILDVTEKQILVLAEEMRFGPYKGRIAKLYIDRTKMSIERFDILLDLDTHLSFPNILRYNGKIYVYPENCLSGKQDIYTYNEQQEKLVYEQTICDDVIWDATMTHLFGKWQLFTANKDDYHLDIYDWDETSRRFLPSQTIASDTPNMRMAGQFIESNGTIYCPSQNCSKTYGGAVDLKKVTYTDGKFQFTFVKQLTSPRRWRHFGLHTLNEYKGVYVIDVKAYDHWIIAPLIDKMIRIIKKNTKWKTRKK